MTMVTQLFPAGMTGLIIAVLIAALVSTIDSALNSLSTVFTIDIYVKKYKPNATQKEIIKTGRWLQYRLLHLRVLWRCAIDSIKGINLFDVFQAVLGFIAPPLSVVFLLSVFWKRTTQLAVNAVLSIGTVISLCIGMLYLWVFIHGRSISPWPHYFFVSFYIFALHCW